MAGILPSPKQVELLDEIIRRRQAGLDARLVTIADYWHVTDDMLNKRIHDFTHKLKLRPGVDSAVRFWELGEPPPEEVAPQTRVIAIDRGNVKFWDLGGAGQPVIVLQGPRYSNVALEWRSAARRRWYAELTYAGVRVVRMDPLGYGGSTGIRSRSRTGGVDILAVAKELRLKSFGLIGEFSSSIIASEFAQGHPGLVSKVALWHPGYPGFDPLAKEIEEGLGNVDYERRLRAMFATRYLRSVSEEDQDAHVDRVLKSFPSADHWRKLHEDLNALEAVLNDTDYWKRLARTTVACSFFRIDYQNLDSVLAARSVGDQVGMAMPLVGRNSLPEFGTVSDIRAAARTLGRFFVG